MIEVAHERRRFGYRRLHVILKSEGLVARQSGDLPHIWCGGGIHTTGEYGQEGQDRNLSYVLPVPHAFRSLLFPALSIVQILPEADKVALVARPKAETSCCPACGCESRRVHSHYTRRLSDLPWHGRVVEVRLRAWRFRCGDAQCPQRIWLCQSLLGWGRGCLPIAYRRVQAMNAGRLRAINMEIKSGS